MAAPYRPHDKLFKGTLDQPGAADALIRERLPKEVVATLGDAPAEREDGSFIDEVLQGSQSDRLYKMWFRDGTPLLVYILIEHKSWPDPGILLQLLRYILRIWVRWTGDRTSALLSMPTIIPLVVYHGAKPWTLPLTLDGALAGPPPLHSQFVGLRYLLVDLGFIPDPGLSGLPLLRAGLLPLKYADRDENRDTEAVLVQALTDARESRQMFSMVIVYALAVYADATMDMVRRAVRRVRPELEETMVSVVAKQLMEEGRVEGRVEILLRQLRRRFVHVPDEMIERVRGADLAHLDLWSDRILDARSLDEVFGPERPH